MKRPSLLVLSTIAFPLVAAGQDLPRAAYPTAKEAPPPASLPGAHSRNSEEGKDESLWMRQLIREQQAEIDLLKKKIELLEAKLNSAPSKK